MATNDQVRKAWYQGDPTHALNTRTDGRLLYSYDLCIGYTTDDGDKVAMRYAYSDGSHEGWGSVSPTTTQHVLNACAIADRQEPPNVAGERWNSHHWAHTAEPHKHRPMRDDQHRDWR